MKLSEIVWSPDLSQRGAARAVNDADESAVAFWTPGQPQDGASLSVFVGSQLDTSPLAPQLGVSYPANSATDAYLAQRGFTDFIPAGDLTGAREGQNDGK